MTEKRIINEAELEANRRIGRILNEALPLLPAAAKAAAAGGRAVATIGRAAAKAGSRGARGAKQLGSGSKAVGRARKPKVDPVDNARSAEFTVKKDKPKALPGKTTPQTKPKVTPGSDRDAKTKRRGNLLRSVADTATQVYMHRNARAGDIAAAQLRKQYKKKFGGDDDVDTDSDE